METIDVLEEDYLKIEKEHQEIGILFSQLNSFDNDILNSEQLINLLAKTIRATHVHFRTEETLFEKYGLKDKELHRLQHRNFVYFLDSFYLNYRSGKIDSLSPLKNYLSQWLHEHSRMFDVKFQKAKDSKIGKKLAVY